MARPLPLRNSIARIGGSSRRRRTGKAITNINAGNTRAGIAEDKRGGTITHTLSEYFAAFSRIPGWKTALP